jgi:hypothetical protein
LVLCFISSSQTINSYKHPSHRSVSTLIGTIMQHGKRKRKKGGMRPHQKLGMVVFILHKSGVLFLLNWYSLFPFPHFHTHYHFWFLPHSGLGLWLYKNKGLHTWGAQSFSSLSIRFNSSTKEFALPCFFLRGLFHSSASH